MSEPRPSPGDVRLRKAKRWCWWDIVSFDVETRSSVWRIRPALFGIVVGAPLVNWLVTR